MYKKEQTESKCVFCLIIEGKIESKKIYESEHCIAILDIYPANPGHVLILPKKHYELIPLVPKHILADMAFTAKKISNALIKALKEVQVTGTNIFIANGIAAGQTSPHCMIHLVPRSKGDGLTNFNIQKNPISEKDQRDLFTLIKKKIDEVVRL